MRKDSNVKSSKKFWHNLENDCIGVTRKRIRISIQGQCSIWLDGDTIIESEHLEVVQGLRKKSIYFILSECEEMATNPAVSMKWMGVMFCLWGDFWLLFCFYSLTFLFIQILMESQCSRCWRYKIEQNTKGSQSLSWRDKESWYYRKGPKTRDL